MPGDRRPLNRHTAGGRGLWDPRAAVLEQTRPDRVRRHLRRPRAARNDRAAGVTLWLMLALGAVYLITLVPGIGPDGWSPAIDGSA